MTKDEFIKRVSQPIDVSYRVDENDLVLTGEVDGELGSYRVVCELDGEAEFLLKQLDEAPADRRPWLETVAAGGLDWMASEQFLLSIALPPQTTFDQHFLPNTAFHACCGRRVNLAHGRNCSVIRVLIQLDHARAQRDAETFDYDWAQWAEWLDEHSRGFTAPCLLITQGHPQVIEAEQRDEFTTTGDHVFGAITR